MSLWESPFLLESRVAQIISQQGKQGCNFNKRKAAFGVYVLTERITRIDVELIPQLPQMMNKGSTFKKPFLKSGKFSKYAQQYADEHGLKREDVGGPFTRVWYTPFDPSKNDRLKHVMLNLGWEPAIWNIKKSPLDEIKHLPPGQRIIAEKQMLNAYIEKNILGHGPTYTNQILKAMHYGKRKRTIGNLMEFLRKERYWTTSPKITPDEDKFSGSSNILELIRQRMVWAHRRALLRGLLELVRKDGKIEGGANPCATPTARMRHRGIVNIPSGHAPFGAWCRSLFYGDFDPTVTKNRVYRKKLGKEERIKPHTNIMQEFKKGKWKDIGPWRSFVPKGRQTFVGYDGAGLELRMFAHYINCPKYIHQILEGDIHSYNQELAGLPTRPDAKTFIYGFLYGAGDAKIGEIIGGGKKEGAEIKARFFKANPKLKALIDNTKKQAEKGYVISIDGRKSWMRRAPDGSPMTHKALNVLLQSAGAIVMKYAMVILDNEVRAQKLRAVKVLDVHDEGQWSCHPDDVDKLTAIMETCVMKAGKFLKLNCPLASDADVGASWLQTH